MNDLNHLGSAPGELGYDAAPTDGGRYDASTLIGSGGMADVYLARDTQLGREVAVKVFRGGEETVSDRARRERELTLLADLNHPGLVAVYDAGFTGSEQAPRRFIVMEYVAGRSLAHRIGRGPLKPRQVAEIGAQMADALSYVHGRGVVHRDVKPENILLGDEPALGYSVVAKLADFGVAQFIDGSRLTGDGSIMGTAAYISPEQARGDEVGGPSDVYSLGLVLLESLTGEREYSGSAIEAALARLQRPPAVPDDLAPEWHELIGPMVADDPASRPTAHDIAVTARELAQSLTTSASGGHTDRRRRERVPSDRRAGRLWGSRGRRK
ncbi:serine/threonine-protein kinase [Agromyces agglutinans]|uniref:serine/threonine-protein kinase n=1 Tax=Agromyces agglutinans TaxID=2662258 RepID=UPI00156291C3|nr:serine/threonine-protein kinase [Agromyces agglutinans]